VAHHLAGINRFTGALRYSVAQHCVVASLMAERHYRGHPDLPKKMLIHDVAEAYYGDMSSPLKSLCLDYKRTEFRANMAVEEWAGVQFTADPLVKEIDDRMWLTESRLHFGDAVHQDYSGPLTPFDFGESSGLSAEGEEITAFRAWRPEVAELRWLSRLRELFPHLRPEGHRGG
jgi:hypothetical protein